MGVAEPGGRSGAGGGGLHFRSPADRLADTSARSTYFTTTASTAYKQFATDRSLAIIIGTGSAQVFQTYLGAAASAYDDTKWLARTDAVRGPTGATGAKGDTGVAGAAGVDGQVGNLANGDEALDALRWFNGAWTPSNTERSYFTAITRLNTFASLMAVADKGLAAPVSSGGTSFPTLGGFWRKDPSSVVTVAASPVQPEPDLDDVWPISESAPYIWVLTPTVHSWLARFTVTLYRWSGPRGSRASTKHSGTILSRPSWTVKIAGVPYEIGYVLVSGVIARPAHTRTIDIGFSYTLDYAEPAATTPTFVEVP